jgi:hypothetical protein
VTFALLQATQSLHHTATSAAIAGHTNLAANRRLVAHTPGWAMPCSWSKTRRRSAAGTSGLTLPADTSQSRRLSPTCSSCSFSEESLAAAASGQLRWQAAISTKSTAAVEPVATAATVALLSPLPGSELSPPNEVDIFILALSPRLSQLGLVGGDSWAASGGQERASATTFCDLARCQMSDGCSAM